VPQAPCTGVAASSRVRSTAALSSALPPAGVLASGVTTIGSSWLTVLKLPSSMLTPGASVPGASTPGASTPGSSTPAGGSADESAAVLRALLGSATPVHGAWGTGRLLRTSLVSVLITDQGSAYVGAVQPSVLYAAALGHDARP
jgi:hypothetical protein